MAVNDNMGLAPYLETSSSFLAVKVLCQAFDKPHRKRLIFGRATLAR